MKFKRFHISFYIIVPAIFAGLALLSAIVAFQLTRYTLVHGGHPARGIFIWILVIGSLSFFCGFIIIRLFLNPIRRFVDTARNIPVLSTPSREAIPTKGVDELQHFNQVFDQVKNLLNKVEARQLFPEIIGESKTMRGIFSQIIKVAPTDSTVLLLGESGTGKELVASSIHRHSRRKDKPFIKLNCVAIPEGLLESELFGHEKGAFTGAEKAKKGKFELADNGTLFLDEIGDMPLPTQAKILRALQEQEFERVGGNKLIKIDVRFIAATNQNLTLMVEEGRFREDLYYRLNVFTFHLPPLRERHDDIPLLVDAFLGEGNENVRISPVALQLLMSYPWPGNIRELKNIIERAAVMAEEGVIEPSCLPREFAECVSFKPAAPTSSKNNSSLDDNLKEIEKAMIIEALRSTDGVQVKAAKLLGINQRSLWHRIKKYGINAAAFKKTTNFED